jgi:hypothetical protein
VDELRSSSASLRDFLRVAGGISSIEELDRLLGQQD